MERVGIIKAGELTGETKLYRYMSLCQFLAFVEHKRMHLTRIREWEDPWEAPGSRLPVPNESGELTFSAWNISEDICGQCWTLNGESDALWRIYSPQREGVLIQTSVEKFSLIKDIKYAQLAPVMYFQDLKLALDTLANTPGYDTLFSEAFLKRKAFEQENEVRLITINDERCLPKRIKPGLQIYVDLNPCEFIELILIDPRAQAYCVQMLIEYSKRAGLTIVPRKSDLYSPDVHNATRLVRQYVPVKNDKGQNQIDAP